MSSSIYAYVGDQIKVGNLAFPTSQEPSPLFSLGQNIVDKHDLLILETYEQVKGPQKKYLGLLNSILYGINDDISLLGTVPVAFDYTQDSKTSKGIGDISLQGEWAFYNRDEWYYSLQATFVGNIAFPTAPNNPPKPNIGFGAVSIFLGTTFSYLDPDWYAWTSYGVIIPTQHHKTKYGNQFFYEAGVGYRLGTVGNWLFNLLVEFNGVFYSRDKLLGSIDTSSGGNVIFLGPTFYAATMKHFIFIAGFQGPITQSLKGVFKNSWRYSLYAAWKF